MAQGNNITFQFGNNISPRYIDPLFMPLQYGQWYSRAQLIELLRNAGFNIEGEHIVSYNVLAWSLIGLGELEKRKVGNTIKSMFKLTKLGKQLIDTYSTRPELFYELMHFLFYSTYLRSNDIRNSRFWIYFMVCDALWLEAPKMIKTATLANRLQIERREMFPDYDSTFDYRAVQSVFPWLQTLTPPFISKIGVKHFTSRRSYCTSQLFHLATDMIYNTVERLQYGTSLAISDKQIEAICKICLLDPAHFWDMVNLTQMMIRGYEIHQGQWETSLVLSGPPDWITLPDFSQEQSSDENNFEEEVEA